MTNRQISRKEFLGIGAAAGAGLMLTRGAPAALASPTFAAYRVALPVPPVLKGTTLNITVDETTHTFHPDLRGVTVWGYNGGEKTGGYLGPTLEVQRNTETTVNFKNNLTRPHPYIPIATKAPDGSPFPGVAELGKGPRILTHMHGGFVSGTNDGNPYATLDEYEKGETQTVVYPPHPRATTLWYHDHALGMTRLNVYAGLAGFVRMRDTNDTGGEPNPLGIPGTVRGSDPTKDKAYEFPIVLQDKSFSGGQLFYSPDDNWIPEFFGDTPVVNGAIQPYLRVEPRMYRLTFLNGSQARFYHIKLDDVPFYQIGSEGGMFDKPVRMKSILLLPAERADVIVDFRGFDGQDLVLRNLALPAGVESPATPALPRLMQFRVRGPVTYPGPQKIPTTLAGGSKPDLGAPVTTRYITLEEVLDENDEPVRLQINGRMFEERDADGKRLVDETPTEDKVEDWSFVNISADTHPIHMHLTNFQVMGRTPLDGAAYLDALKAARQAGTTLPNNTIDPTPFLLGPEVPSAANEKGWKDTVAANPNQVTRIRQMFDLPEGAEGSAPDSPQRNYVYHCHILEHEDNDMMRPFKVIQ